MVNRQQRILLQLVSAEGPMTSDQLAQQLGVSSRTIKSDMAVIAEELGENGAQLLSRRNRGYTLQVFDRERFDALFTKIQLKIDRTSSRDEGERMLYIARKLIAAESSIFVDDLAEELFLSRGSFRTPLRKATRFCESFHLRVVSSPGQGIWAEGEEHLLRMAATELFELHFHTMEFTVNEENYAKWVACEYQERQDIRHVFLQVLRESSISVRDTASQSIARYLIIARNRYREGHRLSLPPQWGKEMGTTPVYATAKAVYEALSHQFRGYEMDEDEVCLLAVMLALGLHPGLASWDVGTTVPFLEKTVHQTSHALFRTLLKSTGLDLTRIQGALPMLERLLTPLALRARYGLDGCQSTENLHDSIYFRSPLGVSYARMMATEAERLLKCKTSVEDLVSFACYISTLLWQVEYPIRSMRLILVDLEQSAFGDVVGRALMERWPEYIRSITPLALYEVRGLKESDYDGVLLGYSWRNRAIASYRYTAPAVPMAMIYQDRSFQQVYNDLLTYAFQLEEVIPQEAAFHVYDDFTYYDADQALQLLAARSARDAGCEATLLAGLRQRERLLTMARPGVAVVCAERALCREERFDIYRLKKGGEWNGTPIGTILFATLTGMRPDRLKALAAVLEELSQAPDQIEAFAERPRPAFEEILRRSVRTAPEKSAQVL